MSDELHDLEVRVTALERDRTRLYEQVGASFTLAQGADRDTRDFRAVLNNHSQVLNALRVTQLECLEMLQKQSVVLEQHSALLAEHSVTLAEHSVTLAEHNVTLAEHGATLAEHSARLTNLEDRMTAVEDRLTAVENRLTAVEDRLTALEDRMERGFATLTRGQEQILVLLGRLADPEPV